MLVCQRSMTQMMFMHLSIPASIMASSFSSLIGMRSLVLFFPHAASGTIDVKLLNVVTDLPSLIMCGKIDVKFLNVMIDTQFPRDVMVLLLPIFLTMLADATLLFVAIHFGCVNDVVLLLQLFLTMLSPMIFTHTVT